MESRGSLAESTLNIMSLRQYACMSKLALSEISCYKVLSPDASRFACGHIMKWWGVFRLFVILLFADTSPRPLC